MTGPRAPFSLAKGQSLRTEIQHALEATNVQLRALYAGRGSVLTARQVYERMGATPMIGQNDVPGQSFSVSDAAALVSFARSVHLARVSMRSANRDAQCGVQTLDGQVSNTCSGVAQRSLDFTWQLLRLDGRAPVRASSPALPDVSSTPTRDSPATSPYPIWRDSKTYVSGNEVVWHHRAYEAKWNTTGALPDAPVDHTWDTPWRYLGPILATDLTTGSSAPALTAWSADRVYLEGSTVLHHGFVWKAKWWTQADTPASDVQHVGNLPWKLVGAATPAQLTASAKAQAGMGIAATG